MSAQEEKSETQPEPATSGASLTGVSASFVGGVAAASTVKVVGTTFVVPLVMAKTGTVVAGVGTLHGPLTVFTQACFVGMGAPVIIGAGVAAVTVYGGYHLYQKYKTSTPTIVEMEKEYETVVPLAKL